MRQCVFSVAVSPLISPNSGTGTSSTAIDKNTFSFTSGNGSRGTVTSAF
ncbi:MAG: hypothetical protein IJX80_09710 [Clostridia bacterium]|nr:hypothetical protein [Clostridia bacterium]